MKILHLPKEKVSNPSNRTIQEKERQRDEDSTSSKGKWGDIEEKNAETMFLSIKNEKNTMKKTLKGSIYNDQTLDEYFGDCRAKEASVVHIDDGLFTWKDIKEFHVYDLPPLCGKEPSTISPLSKEIGLEDLTIRATVTIHYTIRHPFSCIRPSDFSKV